MSLGVKARAYLMVLVAVIGILLAWRIGSDKRVLDESTTSTASSNIPPRENVPLLNIEKPVENSIAFPLPPERDYFERVSVPDKSSDHTQSRGTPREEPMEVADDYPGSNGFEEYRYYDTTDGPADGAVLLYKAEAGSGPEILLDWPDQMAERADIRQAFNCLGVIVTLYDGKLFYTLDGAKGLPWEIDLSRYSAYLRPIRAFVTPEEATEVGMLQQHHGDIGQPLRVFPRAVDEALLVVLAGIVGHDFNDVGNIHGSYRMAGENIVVNVRKIGQSNVDVSQILVNVPMKCRK